MEKALLTSGCTSSQGCVTHLPGIRNNLCLCLAWLPTLHIESSCVYPPITVFMVVGFIWVSHRCHTLDFDIVRDFRMGVVFPAVGDVVEDVSLGCELYLGGELPLG